jgi:YbbR domain-containing protein
MMRYVQNLIFRDWLLKLFSLALAVLTWLAVSFTLRQQVVPVPGSPAVSERTYYDVPVTILSHSGNVAGFTAKPAELDITVQGDGTVLKTLSGQNIRAIVDLSDTVIKTPQKLPVDIITPAGLTRVRIEPDTLVEIIPPKIIEATGPTN